MREIFRYRIPVFFSFYHLIKMIVSQLIILKIYSAQKSYWRVGKTQKLDAIHLKAKELDITA